MIATKSGWILVVFVILQTKLFGQAVDYCGDRYICSGSGYCHEEPDPYYCDCLPGFSGQNCTELSAWNITDVRMETVFEGVPNVGLLQIEVNNSGIYGYICSDHHYFFYSSWPCSLLGYRGTQTYYYYDRYYFEDDSSLIGYGMELYNCFWTDDDINSCARQFETCQHSYHFSRNRLPLILCSDYGIICNITDDCGTLMDGLECINGTCICGEGYSVNTTYFFCEKECSVQHIINGNFTALGGTTERAFANIECDEGYTLVGSAVIVCESNGKWNDTTTCEGIALIGEWCDEEKKCKTTRSQCKENFCVCVTGWYNPDFDVCDSIMMFPFGDQIDTLLTNVDDECSSAILFEQGIPIFNETFTNIHVCSNGLVSLESPYTNPFPHKDPDKFRGRTLFAPFFADIKTGDNGSVAYRSHDIVTDPENLESDVVQDVTNLLKMNKVSDSFSVKFILFSTWYRVQPTLEIFDEESVSTFQFVLATDGIETYAMYIYEYGLMQFATAASEPSVWVGYVTTGGASYSHALSFTNLILKMDKNVETNGITGLMLLRVGSTDRKGVSESLECLNWHIDTQRNLQPLNFELPQCPCDLATLQLDPSFPNSRIEYEGVRCSVAWPSPGILSYGMKCCYSEDTSLFIRDSPDAGGLLLFHPSVYYTSHVLNDLTPKKKCCKSDILCKLYYNIHPIGSCYSRPWFNIGTSWGDPHFRTLDGRNFTFNGWGEYVLFNVSDIELQTRTEPVFSVDNIQTNATIFCAFAAKQNNKTLFHVELNSNKTGLILYGSGTDLSKQYEDADDDENPFNFTSPDNDLVLLKSNNTLKVVFTEKGISLDISIGIRMLTLNVFVANAYRNQTTGLLGNFDGIVENDFITPDGQVLPNDMDEREIHNYGTMWEIDGETSAFVYGDLQNHSNYQHNDYVPNFLSDVDNETLKAAAGVCLLDDSFCVVDLLNAGAEVALDTQQTNIESQEKGIEIGKTTPLLKGCNQTLLLKPGEQSFCQISLEYAETEELTFRFIGDEVNWSNLQFYANNLTIAYSHPMDNLDPVQIRLVGENADGKTSPPVQIGVLLCTGCSGNGECLEVARRDQNETAFFKYAKCHCHTGYDGPDCDDDFDGCLSEPCSLGRTCTDLTPSEHQAQQKAYICSDCPSGWTLNGDKCFDVNECKENNGACDHICSNTEGSYECSCHLGYKNNKRNDSKCDDVNECDLEEHNCTDKCVNIPGGFNCSCYGGYIFDASSWTCLKDPDHTTDECNNLNCTNTAGCKIDDGIATCFCKNGFELSANGTKCIDVNECNAKVCHQQCVNIDGGFKCSCRSGYKLVGKTQCQACRSPYFGMNCQGECQCTGRGAKACDPVLGCICTNGWKGDKCDTDVNECEVHNVCNDVLKVCANTPGSFRCNCLPGYEIKADGSCADIDECSSVTLNNCQQTCINTAGNYSCGCKDGYNTVGRTGCKDIDECSLLIDECDQVCDNVPGRYNCFCRFGYELQSDRKSCLKVSDPCKEFSNLTCEHFCLTTAENAVCACRNGYTLANDGQHCKDINECAEQSSTEDRCTENAVCLNTDGSFLCECPIGTKLENDGRTCSECDDHHYGLQCSNECSCLHGICDRTKGCICDDGWVGDYCDNEVDPCASETNLCIAPNTVCVSQNGMPACVCMSGFQNNSGQCEDIDECVTLPSICDQVCNNTVGSYFCSCQGGFQMEHGRCIDIDECAAAAECDQICDNTAGGYLCSCGDGFRLDLTDRISCIRLEESICSDIDNSNCLDKNGICVRLNGQSSCVCSKGHELINGTCEDIDECSVSPCHQSCTNYDGGFNCSCSTGFILQPDGSTCKECPSGFYGDKCKLECECNLSTTELCDVIDGTCYCVGGWEGNTCSADINECTIFDEPCPDNSSCENVDGTYNCPCDTGFIKLAGGNCGVCRNGKYGDGCKDECQCFDENTITCNNVNGDCTCVKGWTGNCSVDINECESMSCAHKQFSQCSNYQGSYSCDCAAGFSDVDDTCVDIDECSDGSHDCEYECNNLNGSYVCSCNVGYGGFWNDCLECSENTFGNNCTEVCKCVTNNSLNPNQTCDSETGQCVCKRGWTGDECERDVNECDAEDMCVEITNAACHNVEGSHECACLRGFENNQNGECVPVTPEPTMPFDKDNKGRFSFSIHTDILLPAGFNVFTSSGFSTFAGKLEEALKVVYQQYSDKELTVTVTNIRIGSITVDYDIIYDLSDDTAIDELLTATLDISTGAVDFYYDNRSVSVTSDAEPCDIYENFKGPCGNGLVCTEVEGRPECRESDKEPARYDLYLGIGFAIGVPLLLILVGVIAYFLSRRRRKDRKYRVRNSGNTFSPRLDSEASAEKISDCKVQGILPSN